MSILGAHILVLMVVVFAKFGEADGGVSLLVERVVIAPAQVAIQAKDQHWLDAGIIGAADLGDVAGELPGCGIVLAPKVTDLAHFGVGGGNRHTFGKHAHHAGVLLRAAVAAHDVVVERCFDVPSRGLGHLREVAAAVQALLLAGNGQKNNGGGKLQLAENAGTLQTYSRAAAIVVGAGRGSVISRVSLLRES